MHKFVRARPIPGTGGKEQRMTARKLRTSAVGYLFILPAVLIIGIFFVYPAIQLFTIGFTDYNLMSGRGSQVGFSNYANMFRNPDFVNSLGVTFKLALFIVPTQTLIALIMAVLVNQKLRGVSLFRVLFFFPAITSFVAVAIMWKQMYNPTFGLANTLLQWLHLPRMRFLSSKQQALISVGVACIWKSWSYFMVIFISGLKEIPQEIEEAARIDGANSFQQFLFITLPMLKRVTLFVVVITTMDAIKLFIPAFTMTSGGPLGTTDTTVHYVWRQAFRLMQVGPAAAMSTVLFLIIVAITLVQFKIGSKENQ